jgi:anti-anti-sigma factor
MTEPELNVGANADRTMTVRLSGKVLRAGLPAVRRVVECAVGPGPLIVDLTAVTYVDSAGMDLLFEVAQDRGLEVILGPGCAVYAVIQVSGLREVATIR